MTVMMSGRRLRQMELGRCPECGCDAFQPGPRGGAAQNFECAMCGRRYNITLHNGAVIFAHDIPQRDRQRPDDWKEYRRMHEVRRLLEKAP